MRVFTMLLAHLVAALVGPLLVRWIGRNAFYPLAVVPAASAIWLATLDPHQLAETPRVESVPWIPAFGIDIAFRLDVLSWVLALIATGIGEIGRGSCRGGVQMWLSAGWCGGSCAMGQ